jgi:hypothetical protein
VVAQLVAARQISTSVIIVRYRRFGGAFMARAIAIWCFGIMAAGIFGGYITVRLSNSFDDVTAIFGFFAGASAFACARLWLTERRP